MGARPQPPLQLQHSPAVSPALAAYLCPARPPSSAVCSQLLAWWSRRSCSLCPWPAILMAKRAFFSAAPCPLHFSTCCRSLCCSVLQTHYRCQKREWEPEQHCGLAGDSCSSAAPSALPCSPWLTSTPAAALQVSSQQTAAPHAFLLCLTAELLFSSARVRGSSSRAGTSACRHGAPPSSQGLKVSTVTARI